MKNLIASILLILVAQQLVIVAVSVQEETICLSDGFFQDLEVCPYSSNLRARKANEEMKSADVESRQLGLFSQIGDFLKSHSSINRYTVSSPATAATCIPPVPSNSGTSFAFLLSYHGGVAQCLAGVAAMNSTAITVQMGNSDKLTLDFGCKDYYTNGYSDFNAGVTSSSGWRILGYRTEIYSNGSIQKFCNACKYGDSYYQSYCSEVGVTAQSPTQPPRPRPTSKPVSSATKPHSTSKPISSTANAPGTSPEIFVSQARSDIQNLISSDPILAPKFVRMGFHDCVGGCDGCIDLSNPDNNGLDIPINALDSIVQKYTVNQNTGLSRADIWGLAALTAADVSQSSTTRVNFSFSWIGRKDCENVQSNCFDRNNQQQPCTATRGPHRQMPSGDFTTSELLHYFSNEFGFDATQTVALMGAHTLGAAHRQTTGYNGPLGWVPNNLVLSNAYYQNLVGGSSGTSDSISTMSAAPDWSNNFIDNSDLSNIPNRWQWEQNGLMMLDADIALVRDFSGSIDKNTGRVTCSFLPSDGGTTGCPFASVTGKFVAKYKSNELLWLTDFRDVFTAVLVHGYDASAACGNSLCVLG